MGQLVAENLFQEMGVSIPESGGQADPLPDRTAEPQRHPHPGAELHRDRVHQTRYAPGFFPAPGFLQEGGGKVLRVRHGSGR
jgi:hypothetical protein